MVKSAVHSFSAAASGKVNTEICGSFLFKLISLRASSINLRFASIKRRSFFNSLVSISQILVIPDIVIVIAFNVSSFFLGFLDLSSGRSVHPFACLLISELSEKLILLFKFLFLLILFQILLIIILVFMLFLIAILILLKLVLTFEMSLLIFFGILLILKQLWMSDL